MTKPNTFSTTLPDDTEITVEYDFSPAGGDGWNEPRYDASVSIYRATDAAGNEIALPDDARERIEEDALCEHLERLECDRESAMEFRRQCREEDRAEAAKLGRVA